MSARASVPTLTRLSGGTQPGLARQPTGRRSGRCRGACRPPARPSPAWAAKARNGCGGVPRATSGGPCPPAGGLLPNNSRTCTQGSGCL